MTNAPAPSPPIISRLSVVITELATAFVDPRAVLVYVDVRALRAINRIADAAEGDQVIARVSETMRAWSGRNGYSTRLWSNEFIALKPIDHTQMAVDETTDLRDRLAALNYRSSLGENPISVSIGVFVVTRGADWNDALRVAGDASQQSKLRGLNQIVIHSGDSHRRTKGPNSAAAVTEFRRLLANGQLALHPHRWLVVKRY